MKLVIEKLPDLQALYVKELRLLLSAEEMIAIKSPIMAEAAEDSVLNQALRHSIANTQTHASRVREMVQRATGAADPLKCKVVYALFDEAEDVSEDAANVPVRDAALIVEAQRVQHYQIAAYDALQKIARILGRDDDLQMLQQTLSEERQVSDELEVIADRIYPLALKAA